MAETYHEGLVSFIGQNVECIPPWLSSKYGEIAVRLDFSYNRLRSVKGLIGFTNLKELVLDNNNLNEDIEFPEMQTVETLTINKNSIVILDKFLSMISTALPNLTYLSMLGNEACPNQLTSLDNDDEDYQRYRAQSESTSKITVDLSTNQGYYVLYMLPKLNFLDSTPVTESERKEAQRVGEYTKVITADFTSDNSVEEEVQDSSKKKEFTPLPQTTGEVDHKGSFSKCRYVYYGKHSEGNRFIVNNDL